MKTTAIGTIVLACLLGAGCAPQLTETVDPGLNYAERRALMDEHLAVCVETYGVDPFGPQAVGDHELLPGERSWLDCAYQGIESVMIPNSTVPDLYRGLIAESQALTNLVERGELTRAQRRTRIEALIAEIEEEEIDGLLAREPEISEQRRRAEEAVVRDSLESVRALAFPRGLR